MQGGLMQGWNHIHMPKAADMAAKAAAADESSEAGRKLPVKSDTGAAAAAAATAAAKAARLATAAQKAKIAAHDEVDDSDSSPQAADKMTIHDLPSVGSALHGTGQCRPCAWFYRPQGCINGRECNHCHLCDNGEIKARKRQKIQGLRTKSKDPQVEDDDDERDDSPCNGEAGEEKQSSKMDGPPGLVDSKQDGTADDLPSVGSVLHGTGACRPCAWFFKITGCENGKDCRHCHLCPEGEIKIRKKMKVGLLKRELHIQQQAKKGDDIWGDIDGKIKEDSSPSGDKAKKGRNKISLPAGATNRDAQPYDMTSPMAMAAAAAAAAAASPVAAAAALSGMLPMPYHTAMSPLGPFSAAPPFLPSVGSGLHGLGMCRPCAWFWKPQGCANGQECYHCHLCPESEIRNRKKVKVALLRNAEQSPEPDVRKVQTKSKGKSTQDGNSPADYDSSPNNVGANSQPEKISTKARSEADTDIGGDSDAGSPLAGSGGTEPMSVPLPSAFEMASTGSALHALGKCKPCAWFWKPEGCHNGRACAHCHACPEGEIQQRRKAKVSAIRMGAAISPASSAQSGSSKSPSVMKVAKTVHQ
eukprot:TRINITY_DN44942_c0_g1_i1.p1 TRINITY_DN44942_c0_g1~~TRINITY_DN44942_c0_g1_i1.p1  ORF type:complete len:586 (+),score=136.70 TRINITY_DN44942_c0_g1_i1:116-1873(+)